MHFAFPPAASSSMLAEAESILELAVSATASTPVAFALLMDELGSVILRSDGAH